MASVVHYLVANWGELLALAVQHIALVGASVGCAVLAGVPLGVAMHRQPRLAPPLMGVATVLLTVPSIALFGLLVPVFARLGAGIGAAPAVAAVFLYALLPVMRSTLLALRSVDPAVREASRGIGMSGWQRLKLVELPLAMPMIVSGIRGAVVMNIGVMTIASVVGAGGLGVVILRSIGQSNMPRLLIGAALVSLLAIVADLLLRRLQRTLTPEGTRKT
jgi:osmoprotectant transport system permease protein